MSEHESASEILMKIIKERRSIRTYRDEMISMENMEKIIEAATWAPSSCNRQPWHFIVVRNDELKSLLSASVGGQKTLVSATVVIIVCINQSLYWNLRENFAPFIDAGVTIQNILLAAHSLGLGACIIAGRITENNMKKVLKIPDEYKVVAYITLGYPAKIPHPPQRQRIPNYYSFDSFEKLSETKNFATISLKRGRISRLGGDVSTYYRDPIEKIGIFEYVKRELSTVTKGDSLYTYSGLGYFLVSTPKTIHCLVHTADEKLFLREFKGVKNPLIQISSIEDISSIGTKYDSVVSLLDLHFMEEKEIIKFVDTIHRRLRKNGELIFIFLNKRSFYGINYSLALFFGINLDNLRPCGYENPLDVKEVVRKFEADEIRKKFAIQEVKTGLFFPPVNLAYSLKFAPHFPLKIYEWLDILQRTPFRDRGNVAFIKLRKIS